jgi:hypothetical protein
MKVKIVATGAIEHVPFAPQIVDVLVKAGVLARVDEKKPEPERGVARWSLVGGPGDSNFTELTITAHCDVCASSMRFNPRPNIEAVNRAAFWHCGHRAGVPADIARTYIANGGGTPEPFADRSFTTRDAAVAAGKVRL